MKTREQEQLDSLLDWCNRREREYHRSASELEEQAREAAVSAAYWRLVSGIVGMVAVLVIAVVGGLSL